MKQTAVPQRIGRFKLLRELGPAARVLVLELDSRRPERVLFRGILPVRLEGRRRGLALGPELLLFVGLGTVAAAGDDERARAPGIGDADVQRRESAHGEADERDGA